MYHMGCRCGKSMGDSDGHIVYHVFSIKDLTDYIKNNKKNYRFVDIYGEGYDNEPLFYREHPYLWLCDNCKRVHIWSFFPEECFRMFKLSDTMDKIHIENIKKLEEFLVVNLNEFDIIEEEFICDLIERNPVRPYKYYAKEDLSKIYILNTNTSEIDRVYELEEKLYILP